MTNIEKMIDLIMIPSMNRRPVDGSGRCVLPKELTQSIFHVVDGEKYYVDFYFIDDAIIIKKSEPSCVFCSKHVTNTSPFKGKTICSECMKELKKL